VALAGAVTATAAHAIENLSLARLIGGLLFPSGLFIIIMLGAELFTGNCMLVIPLLSGRVRLRGVLRNLVIVYIGNFLGGLLVAVGCAYSGSFQASGGNLALYIIKLAAAKCALPFGSALISGIFTNILVCAAVMCAGLSRGVPGKTVGIFVPVGMFVILGFEHCIANMFFIPAGLFAASLPGFAALAAGLDTSALTWGNFFTANLIPVTLGNIAGGAVFAAFVWFCWGRRKDKTPT
jgi:formate/nitrite transporter